MRQLSLNFFIVFVVLGLFVLGLVTGSTFFSIAGFCAWTPAIFFLGWAMAKAGLKVVVSSQKTPQRAMNTARDARMSRAE